MTEELYRVPSFALLCALAAVFGALYVRARTPQRLLWLIGWVIAASELALRIWHVDRWPAGLALFYAGMELAPLMFLGSISPLRFRGRVPYVIAFGFPLVVFAVLTALYPVPNATIRIVLLLCAAATVYVGIHWSSLKNLAPAWFTAPFAAIVGLLCLLLTWNGHYVETLHLAHSGIFLMTALLFLLAYRRLSPGVVFTVSGLLFWGLPLSFLEQSILTHAAAAEMLRTLNLVKVVLAVGMIVLVLEEELAANEASRQRDHRARTELEAYSRLDLYIDPYHELAEHYDDICEAIVACSRFRQAAVFLGSAERVYGLAGKAGMEGALQGALQAFAGRLTQEKIREFSRTEHFHVEMGNIAEVDLTPLFEPGDELKQLNYTSAHVMPMHTRTGTLEGMLLLSGLRNPEAPLRADDVLPLELLVARMAATRESNLLTQRMMQSEKLAGLGQIAGGVAHELNNPLTVVLGYAELIRDSEADDSAREHALVIRDEARRMKQIVESMVRFWHPSRTEPEMISVEQMVHDVEQLRRADLDTKGIDFQVSVVSGLPRIRASEDQLRQVLLHVLNHSVSALLRQPPSEERQLRMDVTRADKRVQILISDSGPGLPDPLRVFDPFFTATQMSEAVGLGLSICYSIVREHGGDITACNLLPRGSAIVIELPVPAEAAAEQHTGEVLR
jgi:two-component system, NtrC family, sensor kinase